jgi:putative NADH-flavin reductase
MNVVLYGATGMIGSRILRELISRGHQVTAVVRDPLRVEQNSAVTALEGDILDAADVAAKVKGADAVISAYSPGVAGNVRQLIDATQALISGLRQAGVRRLIVVGGAGTSFVAPGVTLLDSGHIPAEWKSIAEAHRDALGVLRGSDLDWTCLSPAAYIQPGERTGQFRLETDNLVMDEKGESRISAEDYAVALVDELEHPKHVRQRFTLGY